MSDPDPRRAAGRHRRWLALAVAVLAIEAVYVFIVSAGQMTHWPTYLTFLDDQAEGFRAGHLHLAVEPLPQLLAQANPLDPANRSLWYWDASLYKGHYYLYWGPLPALLLAAVKVVFRISRPVGDQQPVFALASLQLVAGALLAERIARRLFPRVPTYLVVAAVVALGLANPTPFILARGGVYEAAIVGGHAFVLLGFVFAFDAVAGADALVERPRPMTPRRLLAAGSLWALAVACRISLAPAVAGLALVTAFFATDPGPLRWRRCLRRLGWVAGPLAVGVMGLLAFNKARFDAWLAFGRNFQLSWIPFATSAAYLLPNVYSYLLRPMGTSCRFPFFFAITDMGPRAFPSGYRPPAGYIVGEPLVGVLAAVPYVWLGMIAGVRAIGRRWRARLAATVPAGQSRTLVWLIAGLTVAAALSFAVLLPVCATTNRYLGDTVGAFVFLGTIGAWSLYTSAVERPARRRVVAAFVLAAFVVALSLASAAIGLAFGFVGYYNHFEVFNPALFAKLVRGLSRCGR